MSKYFSNHLWINVEQNNCVYLTLWCSNIKSFELPIMILVSEISCPPPLLPKTAPPESSFHQNIWSRTTSGTNPVQYWIKKIKKFSFQIWLDRGSGCFSHLHNISITYHSAVPQASWGIGMMMYIFATKNVKMPHRFERYVSCIDAIKVILRDSVAMVLGQVKNCHTAWKYNNWLLYRVFLLTGPTLKFTSMEKSSSIRTGPPLNSQVSELVPPLKFAIMGLPLKLLIFRWSSWGSVRMEMEWIHVLCQ